MYTLVAEWKRHNYRYIYEFVGCRVQLSSKPGWPQVWHWLYYWSRYCSTWGNYEWNQTFFVLTVIFDGMD